MAPTLFPGQGTITAIYHVIPLGGDPAPPDPADVFVDYVLSTITGLVIPASALEAARNPAEHVWQFRRQNHRSNRVWETDAAIRHACCDAWTALVAAPGRISSIARRDCAALIRSGRWYQASGAAARQRSAGRSGGVPGSSR